MSAGGDCRFDLADELRLMGASSSTTPLCLWTTPAGSRIGRLEHRPLVATGRTRMRPILMTTLTTVLAMVTMLFGTDMASEMSTGMAIVIIGGLSYATLMTLFVVSVLYDLFYRRPPVNIDVGDDGLDDLPDDAAEFAAEFAARRAAEAASAPRRPDLSRAARAPEENDGEKKEADHDNG